MVGEQIADVVLFERFRAAGDRTALAELIDRHADACTAAAHRIGLDAGSADDALQQMVLTVLGRQRDGRLRAVEDVRAWLVAAACNTARNLIRTESGLRQRAARAAGAEPVAVEDATPIDDELAGSVRSALDDLDPRRRAAVLLHHVDGLSLIDVSAALGCHRETARRLIDDGVQHLRRLLTRRDAVATPAMVLGLLGTLPRAGASAAGREQARAAALTGTPAAAATTLTAGLVALSVAGVAVLGGGAWWWSHPAPVPVTPAVTADTTLRLDAAPLASYRQERWWLDPAPAVGGELAVYRGQALRDLLTVEGARRDDEDADVRLTPLGAAPARLVLRLREPPRERVRLSVSYTIIGGQALTRELTLGSEPVRVPELPLTQRDISRAGAPRPPPPGPVRDAIDLVPVGRRGAATVYEAHGLLAGDDRRAGGLSCLDGTVQLRWARATLVLHELRLDALAAP